MECPIYQAGVPFWYKKYTIKKHYKVRKFMEEMKERSRFPVSRAAMIDPIKYSIQQTLGNKTGTQTIPS